MSDVSLDQGRYSTGLRVLWVVNAITPEASELFDQPRQPFGGWVEAAVVALASLGLRPLIVHPASSTMGPADGTSATHLGLERTKFEELLTSTIQTYEPDVVHVHGTEYPEALTAVQIAKRLAIPSVVSIQGLVSICAQHYMHGIPLTTQYGFTLRDAVRRRNPAIDRRRFARQGHIECATLRETTYVIGRTDWDRACVFHINPSIQYFHCAETLRRNFFGPTWSPHSSLPYSIFMSQGAYPIKGLHHALSALALVRRTHPQAHLYVAGPDPTYSTSRWNTLRQGTFGRYIMRLLHQHELQESVTFLGIIDADQMADRLVSSQAFIMPSSIENSPNSLGEAMLIGTPSVASYVGGIPSMVGTDAGVAFVPSDAPYMLAHELRQIFDYPDDNVRRGQLSRQRALHTHNTHRNATVTLEIYQKVSA